MKSKYTLLYFIPLLLSSGNNIKICHVTCSRRRTLRLLFLTPPWVLLTSTTFWEDIRLNSSARAALHLLQYKQRRRYAPWGCCSWPRPGSCSRPPPSARTSGWTAPLVPRCIFYNKNKETQWWWKNLKIGELFNFSTKCTVDRQGFFSDSDWLVCYPTPDPFRIWLLIVKKTSRTFLKSIGIELKYLKAFKRNERNSFCIRDKNLIRCNHKCALILQFIGSK